MKFLHSLLSKVQSKIDIQLQIDSKTPLTTAGQRALEHQEANLILPTEQVKRFLQITFPVLCMPMQIGSYATPKQRHLIIDAHNLDIFFMGGGGMQYIDMIIYPLLTQI